MRLLSALFFESCPVEVALLNCEASMVNKVKEMTAHRAKEKDDGEDEPTSIFGFVCGANMCGQAL